MAPKAHLRETSTDAWNTLNTIQRIPTTLHKTVEYFANTPTTGIVSDVILKIKRVFHNAVNYASVTWRYMASVRPNLAEFGRDQKLLAPALHRMERHTIGYDPDSVDIPDLRSLEIRMNALTAGLRTEEVTGLALRLEKVTYAGYSTYIALGSLAPRLKATALQAQNVTSVAIETITPPLKATVQYAQDVTSVAIGTLPPLLQATVQHAQEFGSAVLGGPGKWTEILFGPLFKMIFPTIIAISIGGVVWLKPRPSELIAILVLIIVIMLLLMPEKISELDANFRRIWS